MMGLVLLRGRYRAFRILHRGMASGGVKRRHACSECFFVGRIALHWRGFRGCVELRMNDCMTCKIRFRCTYLDLLRSVHLIVSSVLEFIFFVSYFPVIVRCAEASTSFHSSLPLRIGRWRASTSLAIYLKTCQI
jgi:hypothetical protein